MPFSTNESAGYGVTDQSQAWKLTMQWYDYWAQVGIFISWHNMTSWHDIFSVKHEHFDSLINSTKITVIPIDWQINNRTIRQHLFIVNSSNFCFLQNLKIFYCTVWQSKLKFIIFKIPDSRMYKIGSRQLYFIGCNI